MTRWTEFETEELYAGLRQALADGDFHPRSAKADFYRLTSANTHPELQRLFSQLVRLAITDGADREILTEFGRDQVLPLVKLFTDLRSELVLKNREHERGANGDQEFSNACDFSPQSTSLNDSAP